MSENSDQNAPFRFVIKDAPNAQATPVPGGIDVKDGTGNPPLAAYKFKLRTKEGAQVPAVIAVAQAELDVSDLRWETQELDHGEETLLHARIADYDGGAIRFVVEHNLGGKWQEYAQVQATVKTDGQADGVLVVHHPVLPPTGSTPSTAKLKSAQPAQLRFHLERRTAQPQPRADSQPKKKIDPRPRAPAPKIETATLTIKGALAGEAFFIVDAKTNEVMHAGGDHAIQTSATAVGGVYFVLGRDRTAKFEKFPAGKYKVIFPADQSAGETSQPVVQANDQGAHVVDIKDFVHQGAVCEIEVKGGAAPSLELTLSADGTAHVCC